MGNATLHGVEINSGLLWDYAYTEEDLREESFCVWYLSRVLNQGNWEDVRRIPLEVIRTHFNRLSLSRRVRKFWAWYLASEAPG